VPFHGHRDSLKTLGTASDFGGAAHLLTKSANRNPRAINAFPVSSFAGDRGTGGVWPIELKEVVAGVIATGFESPPSVLLNHEARIALIEPKDDAHDFASAAY